MAATPAGRLNRGTILDHALQRAGNTKLRALARVHLNRILEDLYRDHDWPFLWVSVPVQLGGTVFTLPADFLQSQEDWGLTYIRDGVRTPIPEVDRTKFVAGSRQTGATAVAPMIWSADRSQGWGRIWPTPETALTGSLRYKMLPPDADPTNAAAYDADVPAFPWSAYLIDALYAWALDYEQDPRALAWLAPDGLLDKQLARIRGTALPARSTPSTLPLDPQVFSSGRRPDWW